MNNKISSIIIEHLTVHGDGQVDVEIRRKPWRRTIAGHNTRVYTAVTSLSAMRLARTISGAIRNGAAIGTWEKANYGTKTYIIPIYKDNPQ